MARPYDMAKAVSGRRIAIGAMNCPACRLRMEEPAGRCPHCGFTGGDTMRLFPYAAPALEPVLDVAGLFGATEERRIARRIRRLQRRFRQVHWCVSTVDLPREASLRLFGFWLLNAAPPEKVEGESPNAWTVLLLIDKGRMAAAVTCGYAIEVFLSDDSWSRCLDSMAESWSRGRKGVAVLDFLASAEKELAEAAHRVDRKLRKEGGA